MTRKRIGDPKYFVPAGIMIFLGIGLFVFDLKTAPRPDGIMVGTVFSQIAYVLLQIGGLMLIGGLFTEMTNHLKKELRFGKRSVMREGKPTLRFFSPIGILLTLVAGILALISLLIEGQMLMPWALTMGIVDFALVVSKTGANLILWGSGRL